MWMHDGAAGQSRVNVRDAASRVIRATATDTTAVVDCEHILIDSWRQRTRTARRSIVSVSVDVVEFTCEIS